MALHLNAPIPRDLPADIPERVLADVARYCNACWRNGRLHPDDHADATQDVAVRLLERIAPGRWASVLRLDTPEHRELTRAIDTTKKRFLRRRKHASVSLTFEPMACAPEHALSMQNPDVCEMIEKHVHALTEKMRLVLGCSLRGLSIPEVAHVLRMTVDRVSDIKYRAARILRSRLGNEQLF